jgi:hypothetical protein
MRHTVYAFVLGTSLFVGALPAAAHAATPGEARAERAQEHRLAEEANAQAIRDLRLERGRQRALANGVNAEAIVQARRALLNR